MSILNNISSLIMASRNSGIQTCQDIIDGSWKPKNPDEIEADVVSLISSLTEEDRIKLLNSVRYFTDLSIFKLLETLELGEAGVSFELNAKSSDETIGLINDDEDLEIRSKFFHWVDAMGK